MNPRAEQEAGGGAAGVSGAGEVALKPSCPAAAETGTDTHISETFQTTPYPQNLHPEIPSPTSCTLNHKPQTLNHKPQTLNPKPLNPTPYQ